MTDVFNSSEFNRVFNEAMSTQDMTKVSALTAQYVQHKLRENAFCRQILTPMTITPAECQRNVDDNNLYYLEDVEPDSIAMRINWRAEPEKTYINAKRVKYTFQMITSDRFSITENELRAYRMPLTKIIEQNTVKDIQEVEDRIFMDHVHSGLYQATRAKYNKLVSRGLVTGTNNFGNAAELYTYLFTKNKGGGVWPGAGIPTASLNRANGYYSNIILSDQSEWNKFVLRDLAKIPSYSQMRGKTLLMHEATYQDTLAWATGEAGFKLVDEITVEGYRYTTFGNYTFVTTLRDNQNLVNPGVIYIFPEDRFLGKFMILEQTKFWMEKKGRFLSMEAWEEVAAGFGNILGLGVILLQGARMPLPLDYQNAAGTVTASGTQWLINDNTLTSLPALV